MGEPGPGQKRVLLLGASGTIGRATLRALVTEGHEVTCFLRPGAAMSLGGSDTPDRVTLCYGDVTDRQSFRDEGLSDKRFDAILSCLASRTGTPEDAWAIDFRAHSDVLQEARAHGIRQFVLLSAICVQKPLLEFQKAKLAFERELEASGLTYSIVRPTAFFKSLSGQVERVRAGKSFMVFGDGTLTACKPISDDDLARYLVRCLGDPQLWNQILPIGGPGPAITPRDQGRYLFEKLGQPERFQSVPVAMMSAIIGGLRLAGRFNGALREKAELARIGHYYGTQSMLVLDPATGRYSAELTPSFGTETLYEHYDLLLSGEAETDLGDHAVF